MNILFLDIDPKMCAYAHCDEHLKEMIPVYTQILCNVHHMLDPKGTIIKDLDDLDKRFNKGKRDVGKLAIEKTKLIEKIINKGSVNAKRCIEIASGAELTEKEKNATKKSEINPECPSIANPSYIPY